MKKTRFEEFKEKVNKMSAEDFAEEILKFIDLIEEKGFSACILCPLGIKDTERCSGNVVCSGKSDKEVFADYLNGTE